jgi:hypothetical protein
MHSLAQSMHIDAKMVIMLLYRQIAERRASYNLFLKMTNTLVEGIQKNQVRIQWA